MTKKNLQYQLKKTIQSILQTYNPSALEWRIWGMGVTGKSALHFLQLCDQKAITFDDKLDNYCSTTRESFFSSNGPLLISPGINVPHENEKQNLSELDLFFHCINALNNLSNKKRLIIGVTGSVGKTTFVQGLAHILHSIGLKVLIAGNIGISLYTVLAASLESDATPTIIDTEIIILEISSFQLEYIRQFAPDIGVWYNFWPNHLDHHESIDQYWNAKAALFAYQRSSDHALIADQIADHENIATNAHVHIISRDRTTAHNQYNIRLHPDVYPFWQKILQLISQHYTNSNTTQILQSMAQNIELLNTHLAAFQVDEHRMEPCGIISLATKNIYWINDSKATIVAATRGAIEQLTTAQGKRIIHLLLGGLSKGVDRTKELYALIREYSAIHSIHCFGKESTLLATALENTNIFITCHDTLEEAMDAAYEMATNSIRSNTMKSDSYILLSPSGASFDLFKNYQERGNRFKRIAIEKIEKIQHTAQ